MIRAIQLKFAFPLNPGLRLGKVLEQAKEHGTVLLVLDQFEEFFIRFKSEPKRRAAFVQALCGVIRDMTCDVRVIFSLREDYLAALDDFQRKIPELFQSAYRLLPLTALAAREVIVRPLQLAGIQFDERVVTRLVDELAAFNFDSARLQITCAELCRSGEVERTRALTESHLERFVADTSGIEGVFRRYVQAAIDAPAPGQHLLARTLLDVLITRHDTKFAISNSELKKLELATGRELGRIIRLLVRQKILRRERRRETWYELIHECLVPEIKGWLEADTAFSNFRLARDLIASSSLGGRFREQRALLLPAEQLLKMVSPYRDRLRGLSDLQKEFLLMSAIYRHADDVAEWARTFGQEKSAMLITDLLDANEPEMRAGAAAAAVCCSDMPEITEKSCASPWMIHKAARCSALPAGPLRSSLTRKSSLRSRSGCAASGWRLTFASCSPTWRKRIVSGKRLAGGITNPRAAAWSVASPH